MFVQCYFDSHPFVRTNLHLRPKSNARLRAYWRGSAIRREIEAEDVGFGVELPGRSAAASILWLLFLS